MKTKKLIQTIDLYSIRSRRMAFILILTSVFIFGLIFGYGFNESHKVWIIKVFEGLPKFMRVCREGQALF